MFVRESPFPIPMVYCVYDSTKVFKYLYSNPVFSIGTTILYKEVVTEPKGFLFSHLVVLPSIQL